VLEVRQELVADGSNSLWCIAVRYADASDTSGGRAGSAERSAVDYKDELEPEAFARFVELRKRRKAIAQAEGLPAFAVFTDKELAGIAELKDPQPENLKSVKGVGHKRVERFGARILSPLEENDDEASGPPA
jgi:superfamily II DNA helicase RecQ